MGLFIFGNVFVGVDEEGPDVAFFKESHEGGFEGFFGRCIRRWLGVPFTRGASQISGTQVDVMCITITTDTIGDEELGWT